MQTTHELVRLSDIMVSNAVHFRVRYGYYLRPTSFEPENAIFVLYTLLFPCFIWIKVDYPIAMTKDYEHGLVIVIFIMYASCGLLHYYSSTTIFIAAFVY